MAMDPVTIGAGAKASLDAVKAGVDILDKLGALERLSLKLVSSPDKASAQLAMALAGLSRGYAVLNDEILALCTMSFHKADLPQTRTRLMNLRNGRLGVELASVSVHCSRIGNIYTRYLRGWFSAKLSKPEADRLKLLFRELAAMDGIFIGAANELSDLAQQQAKEILVMLGSNRLREAKAAVDKLDKKLAPMSEKLSGNMKRLSDLQDQFVKASRAVS